MASSQIGVLIPLKKSLEKENSSPELPIFEGDNVVGRSNVTVTDKRLSRNHLILSVSSHSSADLLVKGMNPVVINSGGQRKILSSGKKASIKSGDILELIPGSHYFKYVTLSDHINTDDARQACKGANEHTNPAVGSKRIREDLITDAVAGHSTVLHGSGGKVKENVRKISVESKKPIIPVPGINEETLRHFHVSEDNLPSTFRLMKVQGLPEWANTSCVSIDDVIKGDVLVAVLSNYMVDIDWLLSACTMLKKVPQVLVVHGESDGTMEYMKRNKPINWIFHKPPLPISYGTHHSKAMLLVYPRGVRIIVHTANLIYVDWNNKSQGLWMQDFPWKDQNEASKRCPFESDLIDYLQALKLPETVANLPVLGRLKINASFFKKFDYRNATVRLIASVPGYHSGSNLKKWGHMKLRSVLEQCIFDEEFKQSPLVYQLTLDLIEALVVFDSHGDMEAFSSLGSLDEKWMNEFRASMSSGLSADKSPLGLGEPLIIWPTVEDVRWSLEGYAAGSCIPSPLKNVEKEFLKKYWAKWKATHTGRCRAMPHIKTFVRYNGQNLAWFLLTSANLSKAAWGALQKNNSQLMIRSYELGVLILPTAVKNGVGFSCTDDKRSLEDTRASGYSGNQKIKLVSLTWPGSDDDSNSKIVPLPIPYELPPKIYSSQDVPWSWDREYRQKDAYGQVWPRRI